MNIPNVIPYRIDKKTEFHLSNTSLASWLNKGHMVKFFILLNSLATSLWEEEQREQL